MDRWTDLALVSHEVGGALTPARNAVQLLRDDPPSGMDSRHLRLLKMIARSLERTDRVLGNLTSIALPESYQDRIETCRPHTWLRQWIVPFEDDAVQRNLRLEVDVTHGLPAFPTDLFLLEQVLTNLVSNAMKFTPSGGTVHLSVSPGRGAVLSGKMLLLAGGFGFRPRFVQIVVEDTGIGLSAETRRHLFQPFYRGREAQKHAGTGLGLTVSRRLVQRLHGDLRAEEVPVGARFVLTLPSDAPTRELSGCIDALYGALRQELAQEPRHLLVARLQDDAQAATVERWLQELCQQPETSFWRVSPTTWVLSSRAPVRTLYRRLAERVARADAALQRALHVHVRRAGRAAPVDELVLQSVVRCRQPIPAGILHGSLKDSRTEVA